VGCGWQAFVSAKDPDIERVRRCKQKKANRASSKATRASSKATRASSKATRASSKATDMDQATEIRRSGNLRPPRQDEASAILKGTARSPGVVSS